MSHRSLPAVLRRPAQGLGRATLAVSVCVACAAAGTVFALPASAASARHLAAPATGGLDPDTSQHATSMTPAGSPDSSLASHALRPSMQPYTASDLQGVDVASYQHPNGAAINWAAVRSAGYSFAFVKASESTGYANPYYAQDVEGARAAGLQVGAYHFARPAYSAVAQADEMAKVMTTATGTLPPVLDLEDAGGLSAPALQAWTTAFLARVQSDTGYVPAIYSGPYFWQDSVGGSTAFTAYPLWIAHYTTASAPSSVGGWGAWTFWQWTDGTYASPAAVPGISGDVDRDRFAGSATALSQLAAAGGLGPWLAKVASMTENTSLSASQMSAYSRSVAVGGAPRAVPPMQMLTSLYGLNAETVADYRRVLDRTPDSAGSLAVVRARQHGMTRFAVLTNLLASSELYRDAGSTNAGFVRVAFDVALGRAATPADVLRYTLAMAHGLTRSQAAANLLSCGEGLRHEVDLAYVNILARHADASGLNTFAKPALTQGSGDDALRASLYASGEFLHVRVD